MSTNDPSVIPVDENQRRLTDTQFVDRIATMLGSMEQWDGAADYLEAIAVLVIQTGRPSPGDQSDEALAMYRAAADALGWDHDGDDDTVGGPR